MIHGSRESELQNPTRCYPVERNILLYLREHSCMFLCGVASGSFSPKVITPFMPRASQHGLLGPSALKNFFESNLDFKGFHEINRIRAHGKTACFTSGVITLREKDPEATLLFSRSHQPGS